MAANGIDTTSLLKPATVAPVDFAQLLTQLTAAAITTGQQQTSPINSNVQPVGATPAPVTNTAPSGAPPPGKAPNSGPAVAGTESPAPEMPAQAHIVPIDQGDNNNAFTKGILAKNQMMPIQNSPTLTRKSEGDGSFSGALQNIVGGNTSSKSSSSSTSHSSGMGSVMEMLQNIGGGASGGSAASSAVGAASHLGGVDALLALL